MSPRKTNRRSTFPTLSAHGHAHAVQSITSTTAANAEDSARRSVHGTVLTAGHFRHITSAANADVRSPLTKPNLLHSNLMLNNPMPNSHIHSRVIRTYKILYKQKLRGYRAIPSFSLIRVKQLMSDMYQ